MVEPPALFVELLVDDGWPEGQAAWFRPIHDAMAAAAQEVASSLPAPPWEVAVLLTDDARLATLNGRFRGREGPTDILSFPAGGPRDGAPGRFLGDIALARGAIEEGARARGKPLADHVRHLAVHGFLHLAGLTHEGDAAAGRMEAAEVRALARIGLGDPYEA